MEGGGGGGCLFGLAFLGDGPAETLHALVGGREGGRKGGRKGG